MEPKYKQLLSPIKIRNFILKNRMVASNSLPHFLQGPESFPADPVMAHYENKARGAAIVTCTGINNFTREKQLPMFMDWGHFPDYDLYDTNSQNYLLQMADSVHFYDAVACMGVFVGPPSAYPLMKARTDAKAPPRDFAFNQVGSKEGGMTTSAASVEFDIEMIPAHEPCTFYDEETLSKIADSYAEQASILQFLNFDMISLHMCYRANLPARMFSPTTNHRTDKFGGSFENRARFPLMVLERVRQRVGKNFLIEIVWSAEDVPGGYTLKESAAFLNEAKKHIDIVQLRTCNVDPAHPTGFTLEETPFLKYAEYMKRNVPGLIIGTVGGYQDLETCDKAIAEGKTDLIYAARAWISNSDYDQLMLKGCNDDIVPCIRCNKCHGRGINDPFVSVCSVNPIIGMEHKVERIVRRTEGGKRVAIIGGGPSGMRCAMYLQDRGHIPVIYESAESLGGAIKVSDYASFKWPLKKYKDFLIYQMNKRKIEVRLNTKATPNMLRSENYDVVISALGAVPVAPPISGLEQVDVIYAKEAFAHSESLGERVVIIGGGEVGVETGIYLAGKGHHVTVLEMRERLAADSTAIHYYSMFEDAWNAEPNFTGIINARVASVSPGTVCYLNADDEEIILSADSIVVAAGMKALSEEALSFFGCAKEFYMIGDCKKTGTVVEATRTAFAVANRI